jgi:hypothetical protein
MAEPALRIDVTSRPKVGMVHRTVMAMTSALAMLTIELKRCLIF